MKTSDFDYQLPDELIARYPLKTRSSSCLLVLDRLSGQVTHKKFADFVNYFTSDDLIVFNDTRVIKARLLGHKRSGGKIECLVERILSDKTALVHIRSSKSPKVGTELCFAEAVTAKVIDRDEDLFHLEFICDQPLLSMLEQYGEVPIPPYFERPPEALDDERYQTVFAKREGAVAAPTAALHFDKKILSDLHAKQIQTAMVTLHVGAGTFQPVRTESLQDHVMHKEYLEVDESVCQKIQNTKKNGGRVVAIGTTVVRSLETAGFKSYQGETQLFITPGYDFKVVDVLLTNFHLPKSTLLMLVCAFGGYKNVLSAYNEAVKAHYRFFSYGDAMLIV